MSERKWKSKVSVHLIMKNEEEVLDRCLTSMKGIWDDNGLTIADTGSTDKSIEIAKKHGAIVEHFTWIKDFGAARNYALQKSIENCPDADWCCWWDCDDVLMSPDDVIRFREILDQYLDNPNVHGINFPYIYSHENTGILSNQGLPRFQYHRLRVFKKNCGYWKGRIHEWTEVNVAKQINVKDVIFHHFRDETKGTINTKRNLDILKIVWEEAKADEKPRYSFYLGKEYTYNLMYKEAIEMFKTYLPISTFPDEKARALYELGNCYKYLGNIKEAEKWAFEAINFDRRYPDPYILLANIAYDKKDWDMCIAWASMVPHLGKPTTQFFSFIPFTTYIPWDYMQAAFYYKGDLERAKQCLSKCLEYRPHDRRYLNNWAIFRQNIEKIGIVIPTYSRKEKLLNCIKKIRENAFIKNYEIFIGVDSNEQYFNELNEIFKGQDGITTILFEEKSTVPVMVEELIDAASTAGCKYVAYLGDDTEPLDGFLIHAYEACKETNLVSFNDKVWNGEIACHWFAPISLRQELGGFFFYRGYNHLGCDNELTIKAKKLNRYTFSENAIVEHIHYNKNICSNKTKTAEYDLCYQIAWGDNEKIKKDRKLLMTRTNNNFLSDNETIMINIGAGTSKYSGFITLDKFAKEADIKKDVFEPGLFNPGTIDKFLAEHVLEHFSSENGEKFIKVCYDALKQNGEIELAVPDMGRINQVDNSNGYALKVMYGWREFGEGMFHLFGYDEKSLSDLLVRNNFKITEFKNTFEYDAPALRVVAKKI